MRGDLNDRRERRSGRDADILNDLRLFPVANVIRADRIEDRDLRASDPTTLLRTHSAVLATGDQSLVERSPVQRVDA